MPVPIPTPIYRLTHISNLATYLARGGIHAPNNTPDDGLPYRCIHNIEVQQRRSETLVPCAPGGNVHDYVPFYFGYLSPMLLNLKTGRVAGYDEGQEPLIYLVSTCQKVEKRGAQFVFTEGHGAASYTDWYNNLRFLDKVDWKIVYERYWTSTIDDLDKQRRKQAEFLVHKFCDWALIQEIGVINEAIKKQVEDVLAKYTEIPRIPVFVRPEWYYF